MSHTASIQPRRLIDQNGVKRIVQVVGSALVIGVLLFAAAGTLNWPGAWVYLAVNAAVLGINAIFLFRKNPELINERGKRQENTKPWDRTIVMLFIPAYFGLPILAGLDVRFGWSAQPAALLILAGAALVLLGNMVALVAMLANPFFETSVRIQEDRNQQVISSGPYHLVRHPGYVGFAIFFFGAPLALGTWVAAIPALALVVLMVIRTALEDRTLQAELPGYAEYAQRVPYRLLPGIW